MFTKPAVVAVLTHIYFKIGASSIYLTASDSVLNNNKASNKVFEVQLDDDTAVRLVTATSSNLGVNFDSGAFTDALSIPTGMTSSNNAIYSTEAGFVCFVGEFTYIDNISHPVFVEETSEDNWIIGNSSVFFGEIDETKEEKRQVPSVMEIDPEDVSDIVGKLI